MGRQRERDRKFGDGKEILILHIILNGFIDNIKTLHFWTTDLLFWKITKLMQNYISKYVG